MSDISMRDATLAITASALAGDSGAVYRIVGNLLDQGVPFETVLFELLLPSESQVGTRWQQGDYLVADEHAFTAVIEIVVSLLAGSLSRPAEGLPIVVAVAEGDHHSLPARAVAAHLLYLGYPTTFLGANVPSGDLGEFLESEQPGALVLSSAMIQHVFGVRSAIKASHSVGVPVVGGGAGFGAGGAWASLLGADAWVSSPVEVASVLEQWSPDIAAAEDGATDPSPELQGLFDRRHSIAAAALDIAFEHLGLSSDSRLPVEMDLLVGSVLAAEFVDSQEPIEETMAWQGETLGAQGWAPIPDLASPLASALLPLGTALHRRLVSATN